MGNNTVSTTISFVTQTGADSNISIELDEIKNGGKTSFLSGDTVFFKIHTAPADLQFVKGSSAGTVDVGAKESGIVTERVIFAGEKEVTLQKIGDSLESCKWFGNDLGSPTLQGNRLTIQQAGIGVAEVSYKTSYLSGSLSGVTIPPGEKEFPVVVVLTEQA